MFSQAHKFGGASLANVVRIKNAADIISELPKNRMHVVIVSAALGVADQLNDIIHVDEMRELKLETLRNQQLRLMEELVSDTEYRQLSLSFLLDIAILRLQLRIFAGNEDALAALGEDWSARLLCAALRDRGLNAQILDPTTFLKVDPEGRFIDERVSREDFLRQHNGSSIVVVPGGLAVDDQGRSFSLGHKGTDLSAGLVASLLGVDELHIWTDIEGIRTGDPDYVKNSRLLPYLSYREARCFLDNSTGVLHKNTLDQVEKKGIPVIVRSSIKPDGGKTFIGTTSSGDAWLGLTSRGPYTLVNIPRRISLSSLKQTEFFKSGEIVCLSGSNKLHFLIPQQAGSKLLYQLINLLSCISEDLDITNHLRQITIVNGDDSLLGSEDITLIRDCPFELLELDISNSNSRYLFIHDHLAPKAMSWLHDRLFKPESRFAVAVVGAGNVGRNLLQQIYDGIEKTKSHCGALFQIKAVADSSKMMLSNGCIDIEHWRSQGAPSRMTNLEQLTSHMKSFDQNIIVVDTTASPQVSDYHAKWLSLGFNVVTANKVACSGPTFHRLLEIAQEQRVKYLFETTVGAGLPILNVAKSLADSGDQLLEVQAVLSGSLSYLFIELENGRKFSDVIMDLRVQGFTEPDPRHDLSGLDVARKLIILARQFAMNVELGNVKLQPVLPDMDSQQTVDAFLKGCAIHDEYFSSLVTQARRNNHILRYVARLTSYGVMSVGIESLPRDHCFARLNPADNIVQFVTNRYRSNPLIVQGPGAGIAVTAAGLYSEMLRLAGT